jgi:glycosyltransferase involved in cell wall biosynthesis
MGHIPHIAVCRGRTWENRKVAFYNWLDWRIMRYANRVIAVSEAMGEQLCRAGIDPRKITTVHNAIDAESFRCRDNEARARLRAELGIGDECVFVSIGRLSPEKGHTYLIDAFSIVNERFPNTCLLLCGNGVEEAKLRYQVKSLGLAESVVFAGFRSDVANVLNAADVMVLPSLSEGLPNAVLEAFASGTPVIATRVGGVPELVFHEETGLLAEPIDAASLAEQMCRVTETDDLRMSLSNAARELVLSQFTFDEQTRKLEALYDEVLGVR